MKRIGLLLVFAASCATPPAPAGFRAEEHRFDVLSDNVKLSDVRFSPDGAIAAYRARYDDESFVVLGDRKGGSYDWVIGLAFSRDGKHLAYKAMKSGRFF